MSNIDYWGRANVLRSKAEYQDIKYGIGTYEWEMGENVIDAFRSSLEFDWDRGCSFMDIPVRVNSNEDDCLKLWREVWRDD